MTTDPNAPLSPEVESNLREIAGGYGNCCVIRELREAFRLGLAAGLAERSEDAELFSWLLDDFGYRSRLVNDEWNGKDDGVRAAIRAAKEKP